jgi:hypothetical protein
MTKRICILHLTLRQYSEINQRKDHIANDRGEQESSFSFHDDDDEDAMID